MIRKLLFSGLALFGMVAATLAQIPAPVLQQGQVFGAFYFGARTTDLSATTASSRVALGTATPVAWICNTGSNAAYVKAGDSSVTVTAANGFPIVAGQCSSFYVLGSTNIAGITASSTTTLQIALGWGSAFAGGGGGSGGGGGAVTIADGADVAQGTTTDAACATDNGTCTELALLKRTNQRLTTLLTGIALDASIGTTNTDLGAPGATVCATDTGSCSINALMQRLAQRLTSIIAGTTVTPNATEAHLGEVGGNILPITIAMTTSNNSVTTGKSVGGLLTLTNAVRVSGALGASGTSGIIQSVLLTFKDAIGSVPFDVYYFNASPAGSTCTDNTTFALVDADRDKTIFIAHVTDITASNTAVIAQAGNMAIPFGLSSATSMFACVVTRGTAAITGTANASLITRVLRN